MRKYLGTMIAILMLSGQIICPPPAEAQWFKFDFTKTPSKVTNWFKTIYAKGQKVMQDIQDSQFGQFVGDGIKYTKQGIAYAQKGIEKGQELYGKVANGPEVKAAKLSKQIADKGVELKKMQEQRLIKQKEIDAEIELLEKQTEAKIKIARQNLAMAAEAKGAKVDADGKLVSDEATEDLPDIADENSSGNAEIQDISAQISQLKREKETKQAELREQHKSTDEDFAYQILEMSENIASLTKELSATVSESKLLQLKAGKTSSENTSADKDKVQEKLFAKGAPSLKQSRRIKRERNKAMSNAGEKALAARAQFLSERESNVSAAEAKEGLADTMTGESEGSGINSQVLAEQLKVLQTYAAVILADLEMQTAKEINALGNLDATSAKASFNLCDYTNPDNIGADYLARKGKSVYEKGKSAYEKGKSAYEKGKEAVGAAQDAYNTAKELGETAADVAGGLAGKVSGKNDSSSGGENETDTSIMGVI